MSRQAGQGGNGPQGVRGGKSAGTATLPLHGGRVPPWLHQRMAVLGRILIEALLLEAGRDEVLRRLAHPFWFQCLGAVMGMDWHSSGITTSVVGALKQSLNPVQRELGLVVCGGRGRHSKKTPDELVAAAERTGLDGQALARTSRLVAKVDSAAVQDGHQVYLHAFFLADDGGWTVVQQGMSHAQGTARRYHWLGEGLGSFVEEPHAFITAPRPAAGQVLNLTDRRADDGRAAQVALPQKLTARPQELTRALLEADARWRSQRPHSHLPAHHDVRPKDVNVKRLRATLRAAAERGPLDFADVLLTPGLGPRTVETVAMLAEIIYGTPSRFEDPGRFSLALGGKDGHPFPVPLKVYDRTIRVMKDAVASAKLGQREKLDAIARLDRQARHLEQNADLQGSRPRSVDDHVAEETRRSPAYGGMTVMGPATGEPVPRGAPSSLRHPQPRPGQLELW